MKQCDRNECPYTFKHVAVAALRMAQETVNELRIYCEDPIHIRQLDVINKAIALCDGTQEMPLAQAIGLTNTNADAYNRVIEHDSTSNT